MLEQGGGTLRVLGVHEVVGNPDSQADVGNRGAIERIEHDAGDARGALVLGAAESEARGEILVGGAADHEGNPGVGHLFGRCPQADHEVAVQRARDLDHALGEGGPSEVRLDPVHHDHVARALGIADHHEVVLGPAQLSFTVVVDPDLRPLLCEVEERIGVDVGHDGPVALLDHPVERRGRHTADVEQALQRDEHHGVPQRSDRVPVGLQDVVDRERHCRSLYERRWSTTTSMHRVRAVTSSGSMAGNIPTRNWFRPSLR